MNDGGESFTMLTHHIVYTFILQVFFFLTIMYNKEDGKLTNKWQSQRVTMLAAHFSDGARLFILGFEGSWWGRSSLYLF